jgi:hypothetical protein
MEARPRSGATPGSWRLKPGPSITEGECEVTKSDIITAINLSFRWKVAGNWNKRWLYVLLDTGIGIENKLSTLTDGNGRGWMLPNLGGTTFHHRDLMQTVVMGIMNRLTPNGIWGMVPFHTKDVYLTKAGINTNTITHELGHVLDLSTGTSICPATWCGGGIADALIEFIGGTPSGIRWKNGTESIPDVAKWSYQKTDGYGNTATAEYFGEAFRYLITDQTKLPNSMVEYWMKAIISLQSR